MRRIVFDDDFCVRSEGERRPLDMMRRNLCSLVLSLAVAWTTAGHATDAPAPAGPTAELATKTTEPSSELQAQKQHFEAEKQAIDAELALQAARERAKLAQLRAEIERLRTESELDVVRSARDTAGLQAQANHLQAENALKLAERARLEHQEKIVATTQALELAALNRNLELAEAQRRLAKKVDHAIEYRRDPFEKGVLFITDRRIALNGPIVSDSADYVCSRIQFYNNKNAALPIFIVIDYSPGGSVMAGYRILKAMESSQAPVHVVVKSLAASMAAVITTRAKYSYAYPNAIILHHQIATIAFGNLTEQKEQVAELEEWSRRLLTPVAQKLGVSHDEFVARMYKHDSGGNWREFADHAVELGWVGHVIGEVRESGIVELEQAGKEDPATPHAELNTDEAGNAYVKLPPLRPFDHWFLYDRDRFYR